MYFFPISEPSSSYNFRYYRENSARRESKALLCTACLCVHRYNLTALELPGCVAVVSGKALYETVCTVQDLYVLEVVIA